jgi:hypothetical protein
MKITLGCLDWAPAENKAYKNEETSSFLIMVSFTVEWQKREFGL